MGGFPNWEAELVHIYLLFFSPGLAIFYQESSNLPQITCLQHSGSLHEDVGLIAMMSYNAPTTVALLFCMPLGELPDAGVGGEDLFLR